jgi:hypothetical protein
MFKSLTPLLRPCSRIKRSYWNYTGVTYVNHLLTRTGPSAGAVIKAVNTASRGHNFQSRQMSLANVDLKLVCNVDRKSINLPSAILLSFGIKNQMPSPRIWHGSWLIQSLVQSVIDQSRRIKAATIWRVELPLAATNSVGYVWEIGQVMVLQQAGITSVINTMNKYQRT